jgi:hypothetical protein
MGRRKGEPRLLIGSVFFRRNPRSYARRSIFEIRENFFQLFSTLFCEVNGGFVDP